MTASDAAEHHEPVSPAPPAAVAPRLPGIEQVATGDPVRGALDRRIEIGASGWYGLLTVLGLLIAFGMRFSQLNIYSMAQGEAQWAYDSWALYLGKQLPNGADLPTTSPLFLLLQSLSYFLFGVTDAIARIVPAVFGLLLVGLILLLRPFLSRFAIVGMILLAAVSPTLVYTSRTSEPDILVGFCSFLFFVAVLRAGAEGTRLTTTWMAVAGFAFAGTLASGPDGVTALIAVLIGLGVAVVTDSSSASKTQGAVAASIRAIVGNQRALASGVAAAIVTIFVLFTRGFSDATALSGLGTTFSDWGKMMTTQSSNTPIPFFFYTTLLYEILAVVFAIVAVTAGRSKNFESDSRRDLNATALVTWFVVALLLQSFASGKQPDQLSIVTLPLVLLGGLGLGYMLERIPWGRMLNSSAGVVPLALAGILIGVIAALTLVARSNDPIEQNESFLTIAMPIVFVLVIVVAPLIFLLAGETASRRQVSHIGWSALLVVAVLLGLYTIGSSTSLSFSRADTGLEPAAQGTSTSGLKAFVNQTMRLSRDMTDGNVSNIDNTGSYGLKIAVSPDLEWPYTWYFRNFYQLEVTTPAGWDNADIVISSSSDGMENAGYIVQTKNSFNRVPSSYEDMDSGTILSHIFNPGKWYSGIGYLLRRQNVSQPASEQTSVGYTFKLSNQLNPNLGPYDLTDDIGPGSGLGQLSNPIGIALSPDGKTVYVVDSGNQRVERYTSDGKYVGVWDAGTNSALDFATQFGQGPQGITTSGDLVYVADTWNHRVVVLDQNGQVVRELGQKGVVSDNADSPDPTLNPGKFYGPRDIAVDNGEIYVVDTGNERVEVFAQDGTFLRAFGGFGTDSGKMVEPTGIAIGPDGNVYVADSGNGRISVFTKSGTLVREIPISQWQGEATRSNYLAFGPTGLLYATDPDAGAIDVIDPGTGSVVYTGSGPTNETIKQPSGIAVASDGTIWVVDSASSKVVHFTLDLPPATQGTPIAAAATPAASPGATPTGSPLGPLEIPATPAS